ncbi:hypothetical protein [Azospirillum canadense]|uniref:hypothetical protein n=1 Tax=Azospirillum canadense TaxID=403962 RepID=UPI002226BAF8|nr:hypothetical protein [Azospirillum canadense]MCW2241527.1 hypothetical protein [Azospirillum canadense]
MTLPSGLVGLDPRAGASSRTRELAWPKHSGRLIQPRFVKADVQFHKNDRANAKVIGGGVQRPTLRSVEGTISKQPSTVIVPRGRALLVHQWTPLITKLREFRESARYARSTADQDRSKHHADVRVA